MFFLRCRAEGAPLPPPPPTGEAFERMFVKIFIADFLCSSPRGRCPRSKDIGRRLMYLANVSTFSMFSRGYSRKAFIFAKLSAKQELQDVATAMGFRVIAAVGAVAEHSIVRRYGQGRPDAADEQTLRRFGATILSKAKVVTARCRRCQVIVHTRKEVWCLTRKEGADAMAAAFVPRNVRRMPSLLRTLKKWMQASAYRA